MYQIFKATTNGLYWFLHTVWDFWSGLFAPLPYGDPYVAAVAAILTLVMFGKVVHSARSDY